MTNKVTQLRTSSANPHLHNNPRPCRLMSPGRCQTADPVTAIPSTTLAPVDLRVSPGRCQIVDSVTLAPSTTLAPVDLRVSLGRCQIADPGWPVQTRPSWAAERRQWHRHGPRAGPDASFRHDRTLSYSAGCSPRAPGHSVGQQKVKINLNTMMSHFVQMCERSTSFHKEVCY